MTEDVTPERGPADEGRPSACEPWGFWASTAFGLAAILAWFACQLLAAYAMLNWFAARGAPAAEVQAFATHAITIAVAAIASVPAPLVLLALAARRAGCTVSDYLALRWPRRSDLILGIVIIVVLLPLGDLTSWLTGRDLIPPAVVDAYRTARAPGGLALLAIALVVAAPLMEELLFRGFLLPGYARSRLGLAGAIVLTSIGWAVMHVQYEAFYIAQIFILGCVLGWLRWRSGSTVLTIILHAIVNAAALLQVAVTVEMAG